MTKLEVQSSKLKGRSNLQAPKHASARPAVIVASPDHRCAGFNPQDRPCAIVRPCHRDAPSAFTSSRGLKSAPRCRPVRASASRSGIGSRSFGFPLNFELWILIFALLLAQLSTLRAQPSTNFVLHLDGANSYVLLPPNIFDALTQATVEGWVKWDRLDTASRFFDFGDRNRESYIRPEGPQISFLLVDADGTRHRTEVVNLVRTNEWCHLAAVSGPGGAKLYFNGVLAGSNAFTGSFSNLIGRRNYLGKENRKGASLFQLRFNETVE